MKLVKAYVRPNMLDKVVDAIEELPDAPGLTVVSVEGWGHPKEGGPHELTHRQKLETVVPDELVEQVVETILEHGRTGNYGDGKIFIFSVDEAIRIRTGERGEDIA